MNVNKMVASIATVLLLATLNVACIRENNDTPVVNAETTIDHLLIEEVFTVGTLHSSYKMNNKTYPISYETYAIDQFIKIHNPTKEVKYLDGLGIAISVFDSTSAYLLEPKDEQTKDTVLASATVLQFPGSGKEYAIQPGASVLIAAQAINHKAGGIFDGEPIKAPAKALDLSKAMFQWIPQEAWDSDVVFKEVGQAKDMHIVYNNNESERIELPDYCMIALIDLSVEGRLAQLQSDESTWQLITQQKSGNHAHSQTIVCKKVPNDWVVDAVNMCPMTGEAWKVASDKLDSGLIWIAESAVNANSVDHFSKSIQRKHNGKSFEDTNNSTTDFTSGEVSLLAK